MEPWQSDYVIKKGPQLLQCTWCSTYLLARLRAKKLLNKDDLDIMDAILKSDGKGAQVQKLYNILTTRSGAYEILVEELHHPQVLQTGPGTILIRGYRENDKDIPFDLEKPPFNWKHGRPPTDNIVHKGIFVQTASTTLLEMFDRANHPNIPNLLECLDEETENKIKNQEFPYQLVLDKTPVSIDDSLYVKRSFHSRSRLTEKVFQVPNDVFLVKGIDRVKLGTLVNNQQTGTLKEILSSKQPSKVRFVEIKYGYDCDFNKLREKYPNRNVHLLEWEDGILTLRRSSGDITAVVEHIDSTQESIEEDHFIKHFITLMASAEEGRRTHLCLSGTAGMGKTIFLRKLANFCRQQFPDRLIFYFVMSTFLEKVLEKVPEAGKEPLSANAIKQAIVAQYTDGQTFSTQIMSGLLENPKEQFFLFLDGLDEILQNDLDAAESVLTVINAKMTNCTVLITTRPHLRDEVESWLASPGYTIAPLEEKEQVELLVKFWKFNITNAPNSKPGTPVINTVPFKFSLEFDQGKMEDYARKCLTSTNSKLSQDTHCNTGEPLQCTFLGEINQDLAELYVRSNCQEDNVVPINSKFDMFQKLYAKRMERLAKNPSSPKEQNVSGLTLEKVNEVHVLAAVDVIFPSHLEFFSKMLACNYIQYLGLNDIIRLGVIAPNASSTDRANRFSHHTFAEYILAEFLTDVLLTNKYAETKNSDFCLRFFGFIFNKVLSYKSRKDFALKHPINDINDKISVYSFRHSEITYFINDKLLADKYEDNMKNVSSIFQSYAARKGEDSYFDIFSSCGEYGLCQLADFTLDLAKFSNVPQLQAPYESFLVAARFQEREFVSYICRLLEEGKIVLKKATNNDSLKRITPLQGAAQRGNYSIVETLRGLSLPLAGGKYLAHFCLIGSAEDNESTIKDKIDIISMLHGADPAVINEVVDDGTTPILQPNIHPRLLEHLVKLGVNVNAVNAYGENLLHVFLKRGNVFKIKKQVLSEFLTTICKEEVGFKKFEATGLMEAPFNMALRTAHLGKVSIQLFEEGGTNFQFRERNGEDLMFTAVRNSQKKTCLRHLWPKVHPNITSWWTGKGHNAKTLLHAAAEVGHVGGVNWLLSVIFREDKRAAVNAMDEEGNTALHFAFSQASRKHEEVRQILIENQANIAVTNHLNLAPLEHALSLRNWVGLTKTFLDSLKPKFEMENLAKNLLQVAMPIAVKEQAAEHGHLNMKELTELIKYCQTQIAKNDVTVNWSVLKLEYNGIVKGIHDVLIPEEVDKLQGSLEESSLLEAWTLANSDDPVAPLIHPCPTCPSMYLPRSLQPLNMTKSEGRCLNEAEFIQKFEGHTSGNFHVFDSEQVGLTSFLTSLATKIQQGNPAKIVGYIDFTRMAVNSNDSCKILVCKYLANSDFCQQVLSILLDRPTPPVSLIFDNLASISNGEKYSQASAFLAKAQIHLKNVNIYVCTRPDRDRRFERKRMSTVKLYQLLPFTDSECVSVLEYYWSRCLSDVDPAMANICASKFLSNLKVIVGSIEKHLAENVILLNDFYNDVAPNMHLFDINQDSYSACTSLVTWAYILQLENVFKQNNLTTKGPIKGKLLSTLAADKNKGSFTEAKKMLKSFTADLGPKIQNSSGSHLLSFTSRNLGDYLLAELVTDLFSQPDHSNAHSILPIAHGIFDATKIKDICSCTELGKFDNSWTLPGDAITLFTFTHANCVMYIDARLSIVSESINPAMVDSIILLITPKQIFEVVLACALHSFGNLMNMLCDILTRSRNLSFKIYFLEEYRWLKLLLIATKHASNPMVQRLVDFLKAAFDFDVDQELQLLPSETLTPSHVAVETANYELMEYFATAATSSKLTDRGILHTALHGSISSTSHMIEQTTRICDFILDQDKNAVQQTWNGTTPILQEGTHVDLIKYLATAGADVTEINENEDTVAHLAAKSMPAKQFDELVNFVAADKKTSKLFGRKNRDGKTSLHVAIENMPDLGVPTIEKIVRTEESDFFSVKKHGSNSVFFAETSGLSKEAENYILNQAISYFKKNEEQQNLLDAVTEYGTPAAVSALIASEDNQAFTGPKYGNNLMHLSAMHHPPENFHINICIFIEQERPDVLNSKNAKGFTPLHTAVEKMDVAAETVHAMRDRGIKIYTVANNNKSIIETANDKQRKQDLIAALKVAERFFDEGDTVEVNTKEEEKEDDNVVDEFPVAKDWEREYITKEKSKLVYETTCDEKLLTMLKEGHLFSPAEIQNISTKKSRQDRSKVLYELLLSSPRKYVQIAKVLYNSGNIKASKLLLDGVPLPEILQLKLEINGNLCLLKELWRGNEIFMWDKFKRSSLSQADLLKIYSDAKSDTTKFELLQQTFPATLSYYIPRKLIRRIPVDSTVLAQATNDTFVVEGINVSDLSSLANGSRTDWSSNQRRNLTVRFIMLEDERDWQPICALTKSAVHLLQYDQVSKTLFLLKSVGQSEAMQQYTDILQAGNGNEKTAAFEENSAMLYDVYRSNKNGFCISDVPGTGKSTLLGSLARRYANNHPDRIVSFVELPLLTKALSNLHRAALQDLVVVRRLIIDQICPSPLSKALLGTLIEFGKIKMDLFLDGLEEVQAPQLEPTKRILSTLIHKFSSTRIYLTAGPDQKDELVETLGLNAYDIEPLSQNSMVELMTKFWSAKHQQENVSKLTDIANNCLQNIIGPVRPNKDKGGISGTPLNCRILSEVHSIQAFKHLKGRDKLFLAGNNALFEKSLTKAYQRFVQVRFSQFEIGINGPEEISKERIFGPIRGMLQAIAGEENCVSDIAEFKRQHVFRALDIVFPTLADIYARHFHVPKTAFTPNEFGMGILLVKGNSSNAIQRFAHYTLAEFLVAEFLAHTLTASPATMKSFIDNVAVILFEKVLDTTEKSHKLISIANFKSKEDYVISLNAFKYSLIAKFLNDLLLDHHAVADNSLPKLGSKVYNALSPEKVFHMINACCANNHNGLLMFLKNVVSNGKHSLIAKCKSYFAADKPKSLTTHQSRALTLLYGVAKYANAELAQEYLDLVTGTLGIDIGQICKVISKDHMTPLHCAVVEGNLGVVRYLLEKNMFHTYRLLHCCVEYSHRDSQDTIQRKLEICSTLLNESSTKVDCGDVLTCKMIHLELVKVLVKNGAELSRQDGEGNTIIINAAGYMSATGYRRLIQFLAEEANTKGFLATSSPCPLHAVISFQKDLDYQTFLWLIDASGANLDEVDPQDNTLIHRAVGEGMKVEFVKALILHGVDHQKKNSTGQTGLHLAAANHNLDMVRYFISLGHYVNDCDSESKSPLLLACSNFPTVAGLVKEGANLEGIDAYGNNVAHLAAHFMTAADFEELVKMLTIRYTTLAAKLFGDRNKRDRTALHERFHANKDIDAATIRLILGLPGINVNERDEEDNSLVHLAVRSRFGMGMQRALLELGVDYRRPNKKDQTVLHLGVEIRDPVTVRYFISQGVDITHKDHEGRTPIRRAMRLLKQVGDGGSRSDRTALNKIVTILKEAENTPMRYKPGKKMIQI